METGIQKIGEETYYFNPETGAMVKGAFINLGRKRYYFSSNGAAPTLTGLAYVGTEIYYFNGDGSVARGLKKVDGVTYGFDSEKGQAIESKFETFEGKRYYFGRGGVAPTINGFGYVGSDKYYFNGDGTVARGVKIIDGKTYGFHKDTGKMVASRFETFGNKKYYFGSDGVAPTIKGVGYVGTTRYYFNGDGTIKVGFEKIGVDMYYFYEKTGQMAQGTFLSDGLKRYYVESDGKVTKHLGFGSVGKSRYYFTGDGSVLLGLHEIDGDRYYFDKNRGVMVVSQFVTVGKSRFYFGKDGKATTYFGFGYVGTTKYYFNGDGTVALGTKVVEGVTYHFSEKTGAFLCYRG